MAIRAPIIIIPKSGLVVDCANCAGQEFTIHVRPDGNLSGTSRVARIYELVCRNCGKTVPVGSNSEVGGKENVHGKDVLARTVAGRKVS